MEEGASIEIIEMISISMALPEIGGEMLLTSIVACPRAARIEAALSVMSKAKRILERSSNLNRLCHLWFEKSENFELDVLEEIGAGNRLQSEF